MKRFLFGLLLLVQFSSSCENAPSKISKVEQAEEIPHSQAVEQEASHEEETEHFHETSKELKLLPPLSDKEAEYYRKLLKDTHIEIQLASASVLMSHGDRSGESVLLELLKGENQHLRIDSFLKLAERPTKKLLPVLQNAIEQEKDAMARFVMKRALKKAQKKLEEYEKEIPTESSVQTE